jgi:hypothetical protein
LNGRGGLKRRLGAEHATNEDKLPCQLTGAKLATRTAKREAKIRPGDLGPVRPSRCNLSNVRVSRTLLPKAGLKTRLYMPLVFSVSLVFVALAIGVEGQTGRAPAKKTPAPQAKTPAAQLTRIQAELECPSELGIGVKTKRRFCDVLTGRDPKEGILVTIPSHRGPVKISFELHNRHTHSEELVKENRAFRLYTATIGVLTMDNTLVERAIIQSEVRTEADLFDRVGGGAGPGGVKAVAPAGAEFIEMTLPDDVAEQVSILGEKLSVRRVDGNDSFSAPGRPVATISNVMLEYRPAPAPGKKPIPPPKKP